MPPTDMHIIDRPRDVRVDDLFLSNRSDVNRLIASGLDYSGDVHVLSFGITASGQGTRQAYAAVECGGDVRACAFQLNYRTNSKPSTLAFNVIPEGASALDEGLVDAPSSVLSMLTPNSDDRVREWRRAALSGLVFGATKYHPRGGDVLFLPEGASRDDGDICHVFLVDDPRSTFMVGLDGQLHCMTRHSLAASIPIPMEELSRKNMQGGHHIQFAVNAWKGVTFGVAMESAGVKAVADNANSEALSTRLDKILRPIEDPAEHDYMYLMRQCVQASMEYKNGLIARLQSSNYGVTTDPTLIKTLSALYGGSKPAPLNARAAAPYAFSPQHA